MAKSTILAEMERRSQDLIRVYNPLDEDYVVVWDKSSPVGAKLFRVKGKKEEVLIRHIAEKFMREMLQKIVNSGADEAVKKENERRIINGMAKMDSHTEQVAFETPLLKIGDARYKEIIALLYVGIEREYGIDVEAEVEPEAVKEPGKSAFSVALEEVEKKKGLEVEKKPQAKEPKPEEQKKHKCNHPDCNFSTDTPIALISHKRTHEKKIEDAVKEINK